MHTKVKISSIEFFVTVKQYLTILKRKTKCTNFKLVHFIISLMLIVTRDYQ